LGRLNCLILDIINEMNRLETQKAQTRAIETPTLRLRTRCDAQHDLILTSRYSMRVDYILGGKSFRRREPPN
jgi:hypothetical protein